MTTSDETERLDHPVIRWLVHEANALPLAERVTLLKGLVPSLAREMTPREFEALALELPREGERFYEARGHLSHGCATRYVVGERDYEGR
jgi:hypothetical protein